MGTLSFVYLPDDVAKPGRFLQYDIYEDDSDNGNGDDGIDNRQGDKSDKGSCLERHATSMSGNSTSERDYTKIQVTIKRSQNTEAGIQKNFDVASLRRIHIDDEPKANTLF